MFPRNPESIDSPAKRGKFRAKIIPGNTGGPVTAIQVMPTEFQLSAGFFYRKVAVGDVVAAPGEGINSLNRRSLLWRQENKRIVKVRDVGVCKVLGVVTNAHNDSK